MTNEELIAKVAELEARMAHANGVLLGLLIEKEQSAMEKAFTTLKVPRERDVDIAGMMVRPFLVMALPEGAKAVRALSLDAVVADVMKLAGSDDNDANRVAKSIRDYGITWDEIGVDPDGSVRDDSMATPLTFGKAKETVR